MRTYRCIVSSAVGSMYRFKIDIFYTPSMNQAVTLWLAFTTCVTSWCEVKLFCIDILPLIKPLLLLLLFIVCDFGFQVLKELSQLLPLPDADLHYKDLPVTSCRPRPPPPPPSSVHSPPSNWEGTYDDDCDVVAGPESAMSQPCECSQSEVTFWSSCDDTEEPRTTDSDLMMMMQLPRQLTEAETGVEWVEAAETVDLYNSWPVQCSCQADSGELGCEDCRERVRASALWHTTLWVEGYVINRGPKYDTICRKLDLNKVTTLSTNQMCVTLNVAILFYCSTHESINPNWIWSVQIQQETSKIKKNRLQNKSAVHEKGSTWIIKAGVS